jgi:hypothetical protein
VPNAYRALLVYPVAHRPKLARIGLRRSTKEIDYTQPEIIVGRYHLTPQARLQHYPKPIEAITHGQLRIAQGFKHCTGGWGLAHFMLHPLGKR